MRFCEYGLDRGSAQDPPLSTLTGAQKVLQQREYFSAPLVASRRSVDKPLELPCGFPKKKPWTEKILVGTRLLTKIDWRGFCLLVERLSLPSCQLCSRKVSLLGWWAGGWVEENREVFEEHLLSKTAIEKNSISFLFFLSYFHLWNTQMFNSRFLSPLARWSVCGQVTRTWDRVFHCWLFLSRGLALENACGSNVWDAETASRYRRLSRMRMRIWALVKLTIAQARRQYAIAYLTEILPSQAVSVKSVPGKSNVAPNWKSNYE